MRVLISRTNASSTGASESPLCVCCGNLNIGGVLCQITSIPYVLDLYILKSFACSSPPRAGHIPKSLFVLFACSTPILFYFISPLPFLSFFLFCCLVIDISTIFSPAPPPLVLADAAAAAVLALAPHPLVFAEAAATAVFTRAHRHQCKDCGSSTFCEHQWVFYRWCSQKVLLLQSLHMLLTRWCSQMLAPPQILHWLLLPLVFAEVAAAAVFARGSLPLVLAKSVLPSFTLGFQMVSLLINSLCRRCLFRGPLCLARVFVTRLIRCDTNPR